MPFAELEGSRVLNPWDVAADATNFSDLKYDRSMMV